MKNVNIRIASEQDAPQLLAIYAPYVTKTAVTFEYEVPSEEEFRQRIRKTLENYPYLAAEIEGEIVGYVYAGPFKTRPAYKWCVETSIYIREDARKVGVGRKLYEALEYVLAKQHILNLNACITSAEMEDEYLTRNSIQFHEHLGYRLVGEFDKCGFKFGRWYNMLWMEKHIGAHTEQPEPFVPFSEVEQQCIL